ncbi:MAG: ABC transporter, permease protein (cluster 3, basic aa/glutamine/opines) [uncultured Arthrobacter sp.]|uniref:ABC transporter, permease protein (Cluster 3, basic aa/glutamine/opines) n=1 Tax=uncultured Arthrobacter sp. TaxID=114050 RepID=A0A6J4IC62_9MICC|nr:amino acid ABC transporter permease [uncultured Arthrobacter sp.]CAA9247832.1 MAG: ABC transporter, permease protein (cluster 3, basic aa/glutamine/opines) [uncultured Arthrobacter sp.]
MSAQNVLFDAPGPKSRRNILIGNIIGALLIAGLIAYVVFLLGGKGQLAAGKWTPFLEGRTWEFFLLPGLLSTLRAAAIAVVTSVLFGLIFGLGRLSHVKPIRWFAGLVVEFFRAVPVLLMMIFLWLALGRSNLVEDAPFWAVVIALTLYNGSVIAELIRSGVHGLPKGQREAGLAIGMTQMQSLRTIEVPQALIAMLPALVSQFVVILKDSALGYIIGFPELLQNARRLGVGEGNLLQSLLIAAVIFIIINFALSSLATKLSTLLSFRSKGRARDETIDGIAAAEPEGTLSR